MLFMEINASSPTVSRYENRSDDSDHRVFYVIPVESILRQLPVLPVQVGDTGTVLFFMWQHARHCI